MTYATRADLEDRYGADEVALRESVLPAGAVGRILTGADAEIDSYVSSRYTVPLSPVPANIVNLAAAIGRYHLLGEAATDRARQDYEDARSYLRDVQAGRALLESAAPLAGSAPSETVVVSSREKVFKGGLR